MHIQLENTQKDSNPQHEIQWLDTDYLPSWYFSGSAIRSTSCTMELFSRRRWATGLGQQSNNYRIMPFMCYIIFLGFNINTTAFCLGRYSLHLLLLKSSMVGPSPAWTSRDLKGNNLGGRHSSVVSSAPTILRRSQANYLCFFQLV